MFLSAATEIARPVAQVWEFYLEHFVENHTRWDPDIVLEKETPGPLAVGSRIRRTNSRGGRTVEGSMEVVELDRHRSAGMRILDGPMESHGRATFAEPAPGRTVLTIGAEMPWLDPSADTSPIRAALERSAANIKRLVEETYPEPGGALT